MRIRSALTREASLKASSLQPSTGIRVLRGLVWTLAQSLVGRTIGLVSQLYLAVLLSPADFGIIGLAFTVTTVAATLTNLGIDDVLMQRHRGLRMWLGPAFWITFLLATAAAACIVLLSPTFGYLYHTPGFTSILTLLALTLPLSAMQTVPLLMLRARMQFNILAQIAVAETAALAALTIILAKHGFGAYSLAIPAPVIGLFKLLFLWYLLPVGSRLQPMFRRWKYVSASTSTIFLTRLMISIIGQADYVILGILANKATVGVYYFAYRLAVQPVSILAGNFNSVIFPALTSLKADTVAQGRAALKATTLLSFCVMPTAFVVAAVAEPLVTGLYGQKWTASIPIIQILSIGISFDAASWVAGLLLSARKEYIVTLRYISVQLPLFILSVMIGERIAQAVGVAWGVAVFYILTQPIYVYAAFKRVGVRKAEIAALYLKPACLSAASTALGCLAVKLLPLSEWPLTRASIVAMTSFFLYAALMRLFVPAILSDITIRLRNAFARLG